MFKCHTKTAYVFLHRNYNFWKQCITPVSVCNMLVTDFKVALVCYLSTTEFNHVKTFYVSYL